MRQHTSIRRHRACRSPVLALLAAGLLASACAASAPSDAAANAELAATSGSAGTTDAVGSPTPDLGANAAAPAGSSAGAGALAGDGGEVPVGPLEPELERTGTSIGSVVGEASARGPDGSGGAVTIAFGGDIHFEGVLATALAADPLTMLDPVAEMMASADLAVANLETAVTERGSPSPKQFNFRTDPTAFDALRAAGIDVVSMANNHGMDYGLEGLEDSLAAAEAAAFPVIGIGVDAEAAYAPYSTVVNGQRIAVIGATQVLDSSLIATWTATDTTPGLASGKEVESLVAAVADARAVHDTVIVFLHWGIEGETCPAPRQEELADRLVEAGADVIVGGHAHRVQGGGLKEGAVVHYGLGNFVFYTDGGPGADSGVLIVTITGRTVDDYEWIPARLDRGVATRLPPDEATAALDAWDTLRACTDLDR